MNFLAFGILMAHLIWAVFTLSPLLWVYVGVILLYTVANFIKSLSYKNSFRRKMQIATWNDGGNPKVMGQVQVDYQTFKEKLALKPPKNPSEAIPLAVAVAKGVSMGIHQVKKNLGHLCLGNLMPLQHVDVSFQIRIHKDDVFYFTIRRVDAKTLTELAREYHQKEAELRAGKNPTHRLFKALGTFLPGFLYQLVLRVLMWIAHDMAIGLSLIGLPARPFGYVTIADVHNTGVNDVIGTLNPFLKTTINMQIGKATPQVVCHKGEVAVRDIVNLGCNFDHRYADGADGAKFMRIYGEFIDNLEKHLD